MPYLSNQVYSEQDLGISFDDVGSFLSKGFKTGSDIYQLKKQQAEQMELAKLRAAAPVTAAAAGGEGFLKKHGLKLAIGAGGLLILFLVLKKKG
jgi:hypothetical protein